MRSEGLYWVRVCDLEEFTPGRLDAAGLVWVLGFNQAFRQDEITEWGPRMLKPNELRTVIPANIDTSIELIAKVGDATMHGPVPFNTFYCLWSAAANLVEAYRKTSVRAEAAEAAMLAREDAG